jgi:hypothetical protein
LCLQSPPSYTTTLQHPKDFRAIAAALPGRTTGDCVDFFYKHQKLDEFANVRRKQQLKKRKVGSLLVGGLVSWITGRVPDSVLCMFVCTAHVTPCCALLGLVQPACQFVICL